MLLPKQILLRSRDRARDFLMVRRVSRRGVGKSIRQRDEILADLLRSNASIMVNLKELQRREASTTTTTTTKP